MWYYSLFFGLLTIIGGIIGFAKAGSMASFIAGSISGVLIVLSAWRYQQGKAEGYYGLLLLSLLLGGWFLKGYLASGNMMPAGLMVLLSAIQLVILFTIAKPSTRGIDIRCCPWQKK